MSRRERYDDSESESDDRHPAKRARRPLSEFAERRGDSTFIEAHHPEAIVEQLKAQRSHVLTTLPGFVSDMKRGLLTGPRLKGNGLLKVGGLRAPTRAQLAPTSSSTRARERGRRGMGGAAALPSACPCVRVPVLRSRQPSRPLVPRHDR